MVATAGCIWNAGDFGTTGETNRPGLNADFIGGLPANFTGEAITTAAGFATAFLSAGPAAITFTGAGFDLTFTGGTAPGLLPGFKAALVLLFSTGAETFTAARDGLATRGFFNGLDGTFDEAFDSGRGGAFFDLALAPALDAFTVLDGFTGLDDADLDAGGAFFFDDLATGTPYSFQRDLPCFAPQRLVRRG